MALKKINYDLPEFVFLDGNSPDGDTLNNRTVICHIRSMTIIDAITLDEIKHSKFSATTYSFNYIDGFGAKEKHLFVLHHTLAEEDELEHIFEKCKEWYCRYLAWEDGNIIEDEISVHN